MTWDAEKIRDLRLRMGWSQSDLARRLKIETSVVQVIEKSESPAMIQDGVLQGLELLLKQAELQAEEMSQAPLLDQVFTNSSVSQIEFQALDKRSSTKIKAYSYFQSKGAS